MAEDIRPGVEITFFDKKRTIYPVSLRQLRKLRAALESVDFAEESGYPSDEAIDGMVKAAQVILEKVDPELAQNYEAVEDTIDIKSFNQLVAAAMGADPNELAEALTVS
jgi:hypothetical protein